MLRRKYLIKVPPIPKKSGARSFEKEFLEKRLDSLQKFLKAICEQEELKRSIYFSGFVKYSDKSHWEQMKDQFLKDLSPVSSLNENYSKKLFDGARAPCLADFKSPSGEARSRITKELRDYAIHTDELLK